MLENKIQDRINQLRWRGKIEEFHANLEKGDLAFSEVA
jgi:hypothetical protein